MFVTLPLLKVATSNQYGYKYGIATSLITKLELVGKHSDYVLQNMRDSRKFTKVDPAPGYAHVSNKYHIMSMMVVILIIALCHAYLV